jgi:hypothetical protein
LRSEQEIREELERINTGWLKDTSRARAYAMGLKFALGEDLPSIMIRAWEALLGSARSVLEKFEEESQ